MPAKATSDPQTKMSTAAVTGTWANCSGAIHPGDPISRPVAVLAALASSARAIPKSITLGPKYDSSTLLGLRSRWTTPAPWMAVRAAAIPTASPARSVAGSRPLAAIARSSRTPSTYSVTR